MTYVLERVEAPNWLSRCQKSKCNKVAAFRLKTPTRSKNVRNRYKTAYYCAEHALQESSWLKSQGLKAEEPRS